MVKKLNKILSILCVVLMTATVFSAAVMNVLADENNGEEKTFVSLNPCVATNEYIHIVWQENVSNYEIFYCNNIYETGNYENTLRNVISQVEDISAEDEDYEDVLSDLEESLEKCTEGDYKHSMDEIHDAVKDLEKIGNTEIINTLIDAVRDFAKTNILYAEYYLAFNNTYIQEAYQKYELALEKRRDGNYDACIKQFKNSYLKLKEAYEEMERDNDDEIGLVGIDFGEIIRISYTDHDSVNPQIYLNGSIHVGWKEILDDVPHVEYARSKNNGYTWFYFDATKHAAVYLNYCSINPSIVSIGNTMAVTQTLERIYTLERCHYFYVPIREPYPVPPPSGAKTFYTTMNDVHGSLYDHYEPILVGDKYFYKPRCGPGGDPNPEPRAPDLTVSDISLYENGIVATAQNKGTATASGIILTELYKDGQRVGFNKSQYSLQSGKYGNIPIGWSLPKNSVDEIKVIIDPDNNASDGNIDNNYRYETTIGTTYRSDNGTQPWYHYFGEESNIMRGIGAKVNTANGNLYLSKEDLRINDGGLGIKIVRVYNSHRSSVSGFFGNGWTHNYNIYLIKNNDDSITVVNDDGSTDTFTLEGGNYVSPTSVNSKLTKNTDNTFTLWFKDGGKYNFNSNGKLASITDKKNNGVTFSYTDNRLTKIEDNWGISITVNYNADGRISNIAYPASREVKYEYNSNGNLIKVTDAMGYSTIYRYYIDNNYLNYLKDVIDPEGGMTSFTYYDYPMFDRVKEITRSVYDFVTDSSTNTFRIRLFDYSMEDSATVDERDVKSRVEVDKEGKPVSVVRPWHVSDFPRERISWDAHLNKVGHVDANGNAYAYEYDTYGNLIKETNPTSKTMVYGRENIDISMQYVSLLKSKTDELGHITTYNYDENGVLTKVTDSTGNTTEYTYQTMSGSNSKVLASKTDKNMVQTMYSYDSHGNKIKEQDSLGTANEYSYDDAGRIVSIADGNVQTTSYTYDANDKITKITDLSGGTTYTYNKNGDLTGITDKNGNPTNLVWNVSLNKVEKIVDALGNETVNGYDKNGNLVKTIDENGHATIYEYDGQNRLIKTTDTLGYSRINEYDNAGNLIGVTDKNEYKICYGYDELNRKTWEKDALGYTTYYGYDEVGNLMSETNAKGYITSYKYDELGRMIEKIDANNVHWYYSYDANGNLISETDGNGYITTYNYDNRNQLISVIDPLGHATDYAYDRAGNKISVTDANGNSTKYAYDGSNQLISVTEPSGFGTGYSYDKNGNLLNVGSNVPVLSFDFKVDWQELSGSCYYNTEYPASVIIDYIDDSGSARSYKFAFEVSGEPCAGHYPHSTDTMNAEANLTAGVWYHRSYSLLSYLPYKPTQITKVTLYSNGWGFDAYFDNVSFTFNNTIKNCGFDNDLSSWTTGHSENAGKPAASVTWVNGAVRIQRSSTNDGGSGYLYQNINMNLEKSTSFEYDALNILTKITSPLGFTTTYNYDKVGNVISKTDANGKTISYQYDAINRVVKTVYPDNSFKEYKYDNEQNIVQSSHNGIGLNDTLKYKYDGNNRLISLTILFKSFEINMTYEYDAIGNKIKKIEPSGTISYEYDALDRLTKVTDYSGAITTYSYDNAGRRTGMNYPNGVSTVYTYDDASRLLKLENKKATTVLSSYEYTYDNAGNRLSMLEKTGDKTTYTYDSNYRLVSVSYPSGRIFNYTYDFAGNRITERMEYGTTWNETDYYYDKDSRLIRAEFWAKGIKGMVNQVNYSYDNNGNLIRKVDGADYPPKAKNTSYEYDFENRLTKVTAPDATLSFNYCSCPTLTGIDGYGASGCGACADSPSGKRISKTVDGTTIYTICFDPTMDLDANGNIIARYVQNPNVLDEPINIETAGGKYYYLFDGLGSVTGLTDGSGNVVSTYKYDAFGNIVSETGDTTLNALNPYRFTSRVYDKESGLYYYRARYYDSSVGRFTQKDPLRTELREGHNLYVYVGNNPVNFVDPNGLWLQRIGWCWKGWWKGWGKLYLNMNALVTSLGNRAAAVGVIAPLSLAWTCVYGGIYVGIYLFIGAILTGVGWAAAIAWVLVFCAVFIVWLIPSILASLVCK